MRVFRTLKGYVGTTLPEGITAAAACTCKQCSAGPRSDAPSPPSLADALGVKRHPLREELSRGRSNIGAAPTDRRSVGERTQTNPAPSLADAFKKKRSK